MQSNNLGQEAEKMQDPELRRSSRGAGIEAQAMGPRSAVVSPP
jgi:hypothetical protein